MQLVDGVHLVGSGWFGLSLTHSLDSNVYLIVEGSTAALVDAGAGREWSRIVDEIAATGVTRVAFIALTHKHADHCGGAARLAVELDARVYAPAAIVTALASADEDALDVTAARRGGHYPSDYTFEPVRADPVEHGMTLSFGGVSLEVHATPGHTRDHHAYLLRRGGGRLLFCGDLVFARGRISPPVTPDHSIQDLRRSLERTARLTPTGLLPGHGAPVLTDGGEHIRQAAQALAARRMPRVIT
jgi:hydroxyacylglutathione hydrolase